MVIVFKILVGFLEQKNWRYHYLLLKWVLLKSLYYKIYVNDATWKPHTMFSHLSAPNSAVPQPLPHRVVSWFSSIILPCVTSEISKFLHDNYPILWTSPANIYPFKVNSNKEWYMIKVNSKDTITTSVVLLFLLTLN